MTRGDRTKPYSNKGGVIEYLRNKELRSRYTCTIDYLGNCYYNINGNKIPEDVFNSLYPLGLINRETKGNRIGHPQQMY